jgi:hypothetical protein
MTPRRSPPPKVLSSQLVEIASRLASLEKRQVSLGKSLAKIQTRLITARESQGDGPVPPDSFRLKGDLFGPFTRLEWRLLAALWGREALEVAEVLERLYGHDHDQDEDALRSVIKRLNAKLRDKSFLRKKSFPAKVSFCNGFVALRMLPQAKTGSGANLV